jgi:protochlorophyllide reductase
MNDDNMRTKWVLGDAPAQSGRVALVTGANAGLGFEIAAGLASTGAAVLLGCRNRARAERAVAALRERCPSADIGFIDLDLADLSSVTDAAAAVVERGRLDLLVNNAGLMALDETRTADGWEMQFAVNHLGHFALTMQLLPLLAATGGARVVTMSSMGHRAGRLRLDDLHFARGYRRWPAYFQSKLANLLFAVELDRRLRATSATVSSLAAHPGASNTDLGTEGSGWTNRALRIVPLVSQPASAGALPALRAALDPSARSGMFFGPRWMVRGRPVVETPSRRARRVEDAAALWAESERLTGASMPAL